MSIVCDVLCPCGIVSLVVCSVYCVCVCVVWCVAWVTLDLFQECLLD